MWFNVLLKIKQLNGRIRLILNEEVYIEQSKKVLEEGQITKYMRDEAQNLLRLLPLINLCAMYLNLRKKFFLIFLEIGKVVLYVR